MDFNKFFAKYLQKLPDYYVSWLCADDKRMDLEKKKIMIIFKLLINDADLLEQLKEIA